jgi:hypothetical protein
LTTVAAALAVAFAQVLALPHALVLVPAVLAVRAVVVAVVSSAAAGASFAFPAHCLNALLNKNDEGGGE